MKTTESLVYIWTVLSCLSVGVRAICDIQPGKQLNYSRLGLKSIPRSLPPDAISLDLSNNDIRIVPNNTMEMLQRLIKLYLSDNRIQKLEPLAFKGLKQLCFLDLRDNFLPMTYECFPLPVFTHVPNLQVLHIESFTYTGSLNTTYPDRTFQDLKRLQFLYTNTFPGLRLGGGFSSLTALEEFHSVKGEIGKIYNDTLAVLSATKLEKLILVNSRIESIEIGAFSNLKYLKVLDLTYNGNLKLNNALESLYGLQYQNMTEIKLVSVNSVTIPFQNRVVNSTSTRYLKNICVENLDVSRNHIAFLDQTLHASVMITECLRKLTFAGQQMRYIQISKRALFELKRFEHLEYLDLSGNYPFPFSPAKKPRSVVGGRELRNFGNKTRRLERMMMSGVLEINYFPSSLKHLNLSRGVIHSAKMTTPVHFKDAQKLRVLDLSFSGIHRCISVYSGLENLTVLNITGCDCSELKPDVLSRLMGLKVLVAQGIRLNKGLESDPNGIILHHQEKLTILNIANNGFTSLHPELFSTLRLVESLNLSNNTFSTIPQTVHYMASLRNLDISFNAMTNLDQEERKWLEKLNRKDSFRLSLVGNPLSCTCSTLDFVIWLIETDLQIDQKGDITYTLENGTKTVIMDLKEKLHDIKVACISRLWLPFSLTLTSVTFVALCVSFVCYRYRHNIKFWFLTKCRRGATYQEIPPDDSRFDAFVAYNYHDYRWTYDTLRRFLEDDYGYRLCLHHRNFPAGESIQGNIVDAIKLSRKIILIISQEYVACHWAEFEIEMVSMHMVQSGRENVVIAILLEDIPVRQMPKALVRMWKKFTFLRWTNDPGDENLFWGRLNEAMART